MNVGTFLTKAASVHPTRAAVDDGSTELRYEELELHTAALADGLRRKGYQAGDRVVLFMPNRAEYFTVLFGLFRGGFVAVPVNAKLHSTELRFILEHSGARAVIYAEKTSDAAEAAAESLPDVGLIDVDQEGPTSLAELIASGRASEFVDADVAPGDVAWMFYTSGTTGRPKGAMLSHRNLCAMTVNALADICDFQPEDVVLHVAPLSHGSGLYALPSIARGSTNLIYAGASFDPDEILAAIERDDVTIIAFLAPTMIHMLLDAEAPRVAASLRRVPYGGAPIDAGLATAAIERFGDVFVQLYGMGESPMTITYLRPRDHRGKALSSAGIVRTDVEVQLVDESGEPVADGTEGEVCVRGDVVMLGYWDDSEANAKTLKGGWLHTGDIGRFEDGYLYLVARRNDVIISGGSNIYPREVEDVLLLHPSVEEACVLGIPDPKWGESVVAAVVASESVEAAELLEHCRAHVASFKKPKRIEFVDALPKNANGKVLRREIRERLKVPHG